MELRLKDITELLMKSEQEVETLIEQGKIPFYQISYEYRFNKAEIKEWVLKNNIEVSPKIFELMTSKDPVHISELMAKGGFLYNLEGSTPVEVIKNAVSKIPNNPEVSRAELVYMLLEREEMMPTAIGKGIAIPHPRNPIISDTENESVSVCRLKEKVDFGAFDKQPVHTLFIVLSSKPTRHLEILSKLSFLSRKPEFAKLLSQKAVKEELIAYIKKQEEGWKK